MPKSAMEELFEEDAVVIDVYTDEQGIADGVLFDLGMIRPDWRQSWCNIITMNLLTTHGYYRGADPDAEDQTPVIDIEGIVNMLNQATGHMQRIHKYGDEMDTLYTGIMIRSPSGKRFEAWLEVNSANKFTMLLPEDH